MDNPLRSEAAMFRVLLIAVAAAIPVIALSLIAGTIGGLIAFAIELVVAIGLIWRRRRVGGEAGAATGEAGR